MERALYHSLAALLSYPDEHTLDYCHSERSEESASQPLIGIRQSAIASELSWFGEAVGSLSLHQLQELFIQTFDLSPVCSLEMGWHLFGENYDRGLLLVKLRQQMCAHGVAETTELPDHLTNGFRLLARMERHAGAYFAEAIVLPALAKMLEALRGKNNPYEHALKAARLAVRADFPEIPAQLAIPQADTGLKVLA